MNKTMKRGHRRRYSPLGRGHLHVSVSNEVLQALEHIRETSDQGETTSHFVDAWLRQHPRIKDYLEQQQEKPDSGHWETDANRHWSWIEKNEQQQEEKGKEPRNE